MTSIRLKAELERANICRAFGDVVDDKSCYKISYKTNSLGQTSSQNIAHLRPVKYCLGSFEASSMRSKGERPGIWDTGKTRLRGILFSLAVVRVLVMFVEEEGDCGVLAEGLEGWDEFSQTRTERRYQRNGS
ncbi:hypothetical protein M0804_006750 [Polistes exclamans]|nr:hypothetical protein M0804_006750 [Polistes exclamans]